MSGIDYLQWLLQHLDYLGSRLDSDENEDDYLFIIVKCSYLSAVIEAEMANHGERTYDVKLKHPHEDDRTNFLFYRMYYKMLFECERAVDNKLDD